METMVFEKLWLVIVVAISVLLNHEIEFASSSYVYHSCQNSTTLTPNSTSYNSNLQTLLLSLSSAANHSDGFYYATYGRRLSDLVFGLFLCRGDVAPLACGRCVADSAAEILRRCPTDKEAVIWYDDCMLRYSDEAIYAILSSSPAIFLPGDALAGISSGDDQFVLSLGSLVNSMALTAASSESPKFSTGNQNVSESETVYVLVQCTPDLAAADCRKCFRLAIEAMNLNGGRQSAKILHPSCFVMYDFHPFFNATLFRPPPSFPGKKPAKASSVVIVAILVPTVGIGLLSALAFYFIRRRAKDYNSLITQNDSVSDMNMMNVESLQFDFKSIQIATSNFSDNNKLGKGGFGEVYKGILVDGREIAVKRLSKSSLQGETEFKNEVVLVAKLQHRNLVRLLGFCLEGDEKLLIYEYVPNKSLDFFLFDPKKKERLKWSIRCNIIEGICRGVMYLHEDSRLKIIHRDLKASNILLDNNMNAKVSDFGIAKMFGADQTHGNTIRIVGTYGYMAPEYAMEGLYSIKSDIYSFGVVLLEILSGRKNSSFHFLDSAPSLVAYAWKLWLEKNTLDLVDQCLKESYNQSEVLRYIHIGLLCVQEDALLRPTMSEIVLMLKTEAHNLPQPQRPAFISRTPHTGHHEIVLESLSVNCVTVSDFLPR